MPLLIAFFAILFPCFLAQEIGSLILLQHPNGAACLDGSAPGYYFAKGTGTGVNKWYIHHQGGGWCESIADCYHRSLTNLGSTTKLGHTMNFSRSGGYFSPDSKVNSLMYNWNKVFFAYCDGGSFAGNNQTVTNYNGHSLYFRGFRNLQAYHQSLVADRNLGRATDVVISGCSAGGLATYLHLDWWQQHLGSARVVGLPDSGFFLDYAAGPQYAAKMRWVFGQQNATDGVNQRCIQSAQGHDVGRCFFAEHTAPHIRTPFFPMQSTYDTWQIGNVLGTNESTKVNEFGRLLKQRFLANVIHAAHSKNGGFLDSCAHHCGKWNEIIINGKDINQAFRQYYLTLTAGQLYNQDKPFPCDHCCRR